MKEIKTWLCQVDIYRNGKIFRNKNERLNGECRKSKGLYYVGAKTRDEAKEILQNHIKFGKICIPNQENMQSSYPKLKYKEIIKIESNKEK